MKIRIRGLSTAIIISASLVLAGQLRNGANTGNSNGPGLSLRTNSHGQFQQQRQPALRETTTPISFPGPGDLPTASVRHEHDAVNEPETHASPSA